MDNIESISLYNGQKSDIFQPARDFGSSGTIYLRSRKPVFDSSKTTNFKGVFKTGSFDLVNPSILVEHKLKENIHASFSGEYVNSVAVIHSVIKGSSPFRKILLGYHRL